MERLREQVALLQREAKRDKELLHHKDEEFHCRRVPIPVHSHSRGEERMVDDKSRKSRTTHLHREREQSPHKERMASPPHKKSRREEQNRERHKSPIPLCTTTSYSRVPVKLPVSGDDAMAKVLKQISQSLFTKEIEKIDLPRRFTRPTFMIYDGKTDLVEYVSHYNQSMAIYSKNEALMCKIFPSSLELIAMRWYNGLKKKIYLRV